MNPELSGWRPQDCASVALLVLSDWDLQGALGHFTLTSKSEVLRSSAEHSGLFPSGWDGVMTQSEGGEGSGLS